MPTLELDLSPSDNEFPSKHFADSSSETSEPHSELIEDENELASADESVEQKISTISNPNPVSLSELKDRIESTVRILSSNTSSLPLPRVEMLQMLSRDISQVYSYTPELAGYFLQLFPVAEAIQFFEANEKARPLTIRTNTLKTKRRILAEALIARSMTLDPIPFTDLGLTVTASSVPVGATPEYLTGRYMIQSAASMIPVIALGAQPGERVLDMAAAPGGKTTHIAQCMSNKGVLFANDFKKERVTSLIANIQRLGVKNAIVSCMDGRALSKEGVIPAGSLDRVLLDAPCSGSGIISRDPSIKGKRGEHDFKENGKLQKELLTAAIDLLKVGGVVVYSTCSVSVEENEAVVDHLLKRRYVKIVPFELGFEGIEGLTSFKGQNFHGDLKKARRFYPHVHNLDGFFVCKLVKVAPGKKAGGKKDRGAVEEVVWGDKELKKMSKMMEEVIDFEEQAKADETAKAVAKPATRKPVSKGFQSAKPKFDGKRKMGSGRPAFAAKKQRRE
jgi:ribosomal RNA methyltransferase Nop2